MPKLDGSLRKIVHGTGIALAGMMFGLLFNFLIRLFLARYGMQANYGIFSLAQAVLAFAVMIAGLGLYQGATRYIAYFRGKEDTQGVRATISISIKISLVTSILFGIAIFFIADVLALKIFHTPELALPIKIFAIGVPFFALIEILVAIFRGFDRVEPMAIFQYVMFNMLFLCFLGIAIIIKLPFLAVFYAYVVSLILTFIGLLLYTVRKLPRQIKLLGTEATGNTRPIIKELVLFSLPLVGVVMMRTVLNWIETLLLGYFKTPEIVGLYNAANPLSRFIAEPLAALLLIYTPVASGLFSKNQMSELKSTYTVSTKWLMFVSLPIFLVLFLFPETSIRVVFGAAYVPAATALRILSVGAIVTSLFGPNGATLIAMGHSRFIMWTMLATTILNVTLNVFLIPPMGIAGAAIASTVSIIVLNAVRTIKLYLLCQAKPWSRKLIGPALICIALAFLIQYLANNFMDVNWWLLVILFIVYCVIYGLATLFTKSFDKEDIALLLEIEKRSGINAAPLKKILKRFV